MLQSLISPVLPTIQQDLHTTQAGVSWVLIAWLLSASVATPILGRLADMVGKDKALLVVLAAIAAGSLVSALAPNLGVMVAGRVIQGLGGAVYPVAFGILRDEYPPERVPSAVGAMSSVIAVGGGLGTVLAGPITGGLGWRWLFWIPMAAVLVIAALCRRYVPASPVRTGGRIDWPAAALLSVWLLALLLPVSQGQAWGWGSPLTVALLAAAALAFAAWVRRESRSANPVIDMAMMRRPAVWTTNAVALLFGAAMFATLTFLPQLVETPSSAGYGFGASVTVAGLVILPMLATMAVGGMISGPLHRTVPFRAQLAWGSALLAAACLGFAFLHDAAWQIALAGAVFGLGLGLAYSAMTSLIVHAVPPAQTGAATGMNTNIRNIGGALGTAVVTALVTGTVGAGGLPSAGGYETGFTVLAATATAGVLFSLLIPGPRRSRPADR
ncbi:MFS transporter [Streptomyces sp. KK5PA1]|uniref:MFS transporter n=2 Tax=Actinacidiphila acididurans TaxID=2784346 RepID=A0ABS2TT54_9ACTN|nr:MFS transporter [Actinacidiphila acididurans]